MMAAKHAFYWVARAGSQGQSEALFLSGYVALGWDDLGDLRRLGNDRGAFKAAVRERWPDWSDGRVQNSASQLYRFVYELKKGDPILYPSKVTREVHVGKIVGDYEFVAGDSVFNRRAVEWNQKASRDKLAQGVRFELGSALSLFQLRNYVSDFELALQSDYLPEEDKTISRVAEESQVAEQVEAATKAFVLDYLLRHEKGYPLQEVVANVLRAIGYKVRVLPEGPDGGIDLVARRDELEIEPPIIKVQVKSGAVGDPEVARLCGKLSPTDLGMVVTLAGFTKRAWEFQKTKSSLRLIDGDEFVTLLLDHYEKLDPTLKSALSLKRVFIPTSRD